MPEIRERTVLWFSENEIKEEECNFQKPKKVTAGLQTYAIKSDFMYLERRGSTAWETY